MKERAELSGERARDLVIRDLRARIIELEQEVASTAERTGRVRSAIVAALRVVNSVTNDNTYRMLLDAIVIIDRDGGQASRGYHQRLGAKWMCDAIVRWLRTTFVQNRNAQWLASDLERKWEDEDFWRPPVSPQRKDGPE